MGAKNFDRHGLTRTSGQQQAGAKLSSPAELRFAVKIENGRGQWRAECQEGRWLLWNGTDLAASCGYGEIAHLYAQHLADAMNGEAAR